MCIHWCCKHCVDKLTKLQHRWAYERCNEYFIARSQDETTNNCPKGPWELRRAHHRHPYRGPQRCDHCKNASRKDKKLQQSVRQKANIALGHRPDYNGAIYLGELEIAETTHGTWQPLLEPGKLDAMRAKWESFNMTHRHLPSHELEREWTKKFTASKSVDLKVGVSPQISELGPTAGQWMSRKNGHQVSTVLAGEVSQNSLQQQIYRHTTSTKYKKYDDPSPSAPGAIQCKPTSIITRPDSMQEVSPIMEEDIQHKPNVGPPADTDERVLIPVEGTSSRTMGHQQQPLYRICPGTTKEYNYSRDSDCGKFQGNPAHSLSSHPTRTRPWDL